MPSLAMDNDALYDALYEHPKVSYHGCNNEYYQYIFDQLEIGISSWNPSGDNSPLFEAIEEFDRLDPGDKEIIAKMGKHPDARVAITVDMNAFANINGNPERAFNFLGGISHQLSMDRSTSLLGLAIEYLNSNRFHGFIRSLIDLHTSALLYQFCQFDGVCIIHAIADHPVHGILLQWIADNHAGILHIMTTLPGHRHPLHYLIESMLVGGGRLSASTNQWEEEEDGIRFPEFNALKHFNLLIKTNPQLLQLKDQAGDNFLHWLLSYGITSNNVGTIKSIVCQDYVLPEHVLVLGSYPGPLSRALLELMKEGGEHEASADICKCLMKLCPEAVALEQGNGWFPIDIITIPAKQYHLAYTCIKEVYVCLMRLHLVETVNPVNLENNGIFGTFPSKLYHLLTQEKDLIEFMHQLPEDMCAFQEVVSGTEDGLLHAVNEAMGGWVTVKVQQSQAGLERIENEVQKLIRG